MAIKSVSIRIEEGMLQKLGFVADYEGPVGEQSYSGAHPGEYPGL